MEREGMGSEGKKRRGEKGPSHAFCFSDLGSPESKMH